MALLVKDLPADAGDVRDAGSIQYIIIAEFSVVQDMTGRCMSMILMSSDFKTDLTPSIKGEGSLHRKV